MTFVAFNTEECQPSPWRVPPSVMRGTGQASGMCHLQSRRVQRMLVACATQACGMGHAAGNMPPLPSWGEHARGVPPGGAAIRSGGEDPRATWQASGASLTDWEGRADSVACATSSSGGGRGPWPCGECHPTTGGSRECLWRVPLGVSYSGGEMRGTRATLRPSG